MYRYCCFCADPNLPHGYPPVRCNNTLGRENVSSYFGGSSKYGGCTSSKSGVRARTLAYTRLHPGFVCSFRSNCCWCRNCLHLASLHVPASHICHPIPRAALPCVLFAIYPTNINFDAITNNAHNAQLTPHNAQHKPHAARRTPPQRATCNHQGSADYECWRSNLGKKFTATQPGWWYSSLDQGRSKSP